MVGIAGLWLLLAASCSTSSQAPAESQDARTVTASVGSTAVLQCPGPPDLKVDWQHQGEVLVQAGRVVADDRRLMVVGSSLVNRAVRRDDQGTYRCTAPNQPGQDVQLRVKGCHSNEYTCADELCIERAYRCDGLANCVDGDDEENCEPHDCKGTNIYCGNGKCVPLEYFCDENDDCGNGFDEANCSRPIPVDCPAGEFPCGDGECIPLLKRCDGKPDCENRADEVLELCRRPDSSNMIDNRKEGCAAGSRSCGDGTCIPSAWWCDGHVDCDSAQDEKGCGAQDCVGRYCGDGRCVEAHMKCEKQQAGAVPGKLDQDSQHLHGLAFATNKTLELHRLIASTVWKSCKLQYELAHGIVADSTLCAEGQWSCEPGTRDPPTCLELARRCDGQQDCPDGRDELACDVQSACGRDPTTV